MPSMHGLLVVLLHLGSSNHILQFHLELSRWPSLLRSISPNHQLEVVPDLLERVEESWVDLQVKHKSQHHKDYPDIQSYGYYDEYEF
ncbi:hypothetical protein Tco_0874051 [Tanacetum coccineum]|uniref:Uncharacterized protein n=1 Tax=Tanacetum coccineum TaxID=301880 RepID=A0ABQ5BKJ2_9ASTR